MKNVNESKLYQELEKRTVSLWSIPVTSVPYVVEALKKDVINALDNDKMELVDGLLYAINHAMKEYKEMVNKVEAEMKEGGADE